MKSLFSLLLLLLCLPVEAQMMEPVHFKSVLNKSKTAEAEIVFTATIDDGWHVYSTDLGDDGPVQATFHAVKLTGAELVGRLTPRGKVVEEYDDMFGMKLRFFESKATFVQKIRFTAEKYSIDCYLQYGACNDQMCMPPTQVPLKTSGTAPMTAAAAKEDVKAAEAPLATEAGVPEDTASAATADTVRSVATVADAELYAPVIDELKAYEERPTDNSLLYIFLAGIVGGLLALLTPCVWPIIPMTVSFFLKQSGSGSQAIRKAIIYGVSIVVIYVALGLAVTLLFGASALNALSTNAVFNILFCLLLVVFAASFFGAFELTLPSKWVNAVDAKTDRTSGLLSIFFMAFTLTLVSFSCTGPIIGFLLVAVTAEGSIIAPTVGMLGFAIALAVPFTLFAMFPSMLKKAPRSGGWMNEVKVVLGFIELAFALKFLSVADLAYGWHLLDREVFISLWIALFGLLGAYMLGWLRFPSDDADRRASVPGFFIGLVSIAFAVYMLPGLWGAPLKAISAFAPPMATQDFKLGQNSVEAQYTDYDEGMAAARRLGKPAMIDFTGFGCVNCRKMEAAVWTDPTVADMLRRDYVLISLYVDDKTPLTKPITVTENGQERTLATVGDRWSWLQRTKIGSNTQPVYVLLNNNGKPLAGTRSYDEDIPAYKEWLEGGLKKYKQQ